MPDFIPAPLAAMVEIRAAMDNEPAENTLWFQRANAITQENLNQLTAGLASWVENELVAGLPTQTVFREIYGTDQGSADGITSPVTMPTGLTGNLTGDMLPNNNTKALSLRTTRRGKSFRGRNYILGLLEGDVSVNLWSSTRAQQLINIYQILIGEGAVAPGWTWVVCSRYTNKLPRVQAVTTPVIDVKFVHLRMNSQRGRIPGN